MEGDDWPGRQGANFGSLKASRVGFLFMQSTQKNHNDSHCHSVCFTVRERDGGRDGFKSRWAAEQNKLGLEYLYIYIYIYLFIYLFNG